MEMSGQFLLQPLNIGTLEMSGLFYFRRFNPGNEPIRKVFVRCFYEVKNNALRRDHVCPSGLQPACDLVSQLNRLSDFHEIWYMSYFAKVVEQELLSRNVANSHTLRKEVFCPYFPYFLTDLG